MWLYFLQIQVINKNFPTPFTQDLPHTRHSNTHTHTHNIIASENYATFPARAGDAEKKIRVTIITSLPTPHRRSALEVRTNPQQSRS